MIVVYEKELMVTIDYTGEEKDCVWHGTSPICDGGCNVVGHFVKKTSKGGEFENDGKACLTGVKVLCCPGVSVSI